MHDMKPKKLLPGADPIFIEGNEAGFLFVHGFTAAPYEGREMAEWMHKKAGLTVSVPLLPGHGTHPGDLRGIAWLDWYLHVREKYFELRQQCKKIFVCGLSMGGALVLHLASHHKVDGVITLAGAVFIKDWRLFLLPVARYLIPYHFKSKGPDVKNTAIKKEIPNYSKYPVRTIYQLLALLEHTRQDLPEVFAPALLIHSKKDRTVPFDNLQYIYDRLSSKEKEMYVLEESYHVITIDVEKEKVFNKVSMFIGEELSGY
jgi:carboxylesterase